VGYWQHLGAWIQLVTGLLLVGIAEMTAGDDGSDVNHMKIGIKLVTLIAILIAAVIGRRKVKACFYWSGAQCGWPDAH